MRVSVDADKCVGSGLCEDICPEVFKLNGDAATVKCESVPPRYEEACREASELCPMNAICIED